MNAPDTDSSRSDSSLPDAPGLQVESSAARRRYFKTVLILLVLVTTALAVGASVVLFAMRQEPTQTSTVSPTLTIEASKKPAPVITWSENPVEVILSPGEMAARSLTVTSNRKLGGLRLCISPTLVPFVKLEVLKKHELDAEDAALEASETEPDDELAIDEDTDSTRKGCEGDHLKLKLNPRKKTPQAVRLTFAVPADTPLGTYEGTVEIWRKHQTLLQTMKAVVQIWTTIADQSLAFSIKVPSGFVVEDTRQSSQGLIGGKVFFRPDSTSILVVHIYNNPSNLAVREWFDSVRRGQEFSSGLDQPVDVVDTITDVSILGRPGINVIGTLFDHVEQRIFIADGTRIVEFPTSLRAIESLPADVSGILTTVSLP